MSSPLRIVLVGCGDIAVTAHLPALHRSAAAEVVAVVDVDEGRRSAVAAKYDVPAFASLSEAMTSRPEAAVIATPPHITAELSEEALRNNLHVLCEKPMATDLAAARRLHERAGASDRIVQVGFTNRFSPLVQWLRAAIAEGRLGSPLVFTLGAYDERYDPADPVHFGRMTRFLERAPAFVHEGAHLVDYVAYLSGARATRVFAAGRRSSPSYPSENFVAATVDWDNGDLARLEVGWLFPALPSGHFRVLGPRAIVEIVRREGRLTFDDGQEREEHTLGADWNDVSFDGQLAQFVKSVRGEAERGPTTLDGLVSLELSDAVVRSMREGRQVDVSGGPVGDAARAATA